MSELERIYAQVPPREADWPETDPEDTYEDEGFDDFDEESARLPIEQLRMACGCGQDDCEALASFRADDGRLTINFASHSDHFAIDLQFIRQVASQLADESRSDDSHAPAE